MDLSCFRQRHCPDLLERLRRSAPGPFTAFGACRATADPPLLPVDDQTAVNLGDLCPEFGTGGMEPLRDPAGLVATGQPGVAVVQRERYRFETPRLRLEGDEEQQAKVVAQL